MHLAMHIFRRLCYILKTLLGEEFTRAINGRFLKRFDPSIEVGS